jgi:ribosome maturation factor RimP
MPDELEQRIEDQVAELGFELVELERAGSKSRPILRLRVDVPGSEPGAGISIDDCASPGASCSWSIPTSATRSVWAILICGTGRSS